MQRHKGLGSAGFSELTATPVAPMLVSKVGEGTVVSLVTGAHGPWDWPWAEAYLGFKMLP